MYTWITRKGSHWKGGQRRNTEESREHVERKNNRWP